MYQLEAPRLDRSIHGVFGYINVSFCSPVQWLLYTKQPLKNIIAFSALLAMIYSLQYLSSPSAVKKHVTRTPLL